MYLYNGIKTGDITGNFINNYTTNAGGVAYLRGGTFGNIKGNFIGNYAGAGGGVLYLVSGTFGDIEGNFVGNVGTGAAIYSSGSKIGQVDDDGNIVGGIVNSNFYNNIGRNKSNNESYAGAIMYSGTTPLNIIAKDGGTSEFSGNKVVYGDGRIDDKAIHMSSTGATLNLKTTNNGSIKLNDNINGSEGFNLNLTGDNTGSITFNNDIKNANISLTDANLVLGRDDVFAESKSLTLNSGSVNMMNNQIGELKVPELILNGDVKFAADLDINTGKMDTIAAETFNHQQGTINVDKLNLMGDVSDKEIKLDFAQGPIKEYIKVEVTEYLSKIYKYDVSYDEETGEIKFEKHNINAGGVGGSSSAPQTEQFNPSVYSGAVAAQAGGFTTQLQSYDEAFKNVDNIMNMTKLQRAELKMQNKVAINDANVAYDPTLNSYNSKDGWFRAYTTFEKVNLDNGPKVSNTGYGSYFGADSDIYELGKGWDGQFGVYGGYNGSHQSYQGVSTYQNGGTLGLVGIAYKDNFFTGLTVNAGASTGEADTMYGNDNFTMLMAGVASKSGYNFEFKEGKFIVQPSYMMSYSFVNTFDYTAASGVRIESDPLHAIHIEPGLKFIGNLNNGWQPYGSVSMVWNIMDDAKFKANDVALPDMSVKPYVKYGVGVQKRIGEKFTGFFQTYLTHGGRNGVGLQLGGKWLIGKDNPEKVQNKSQQKISNKTPILPKTKFELKYTNNTKISNNL